MSVTERAVEQGVEEALGDSLMWVDTADNLFVVSTVGLDEIEESFLDIEVEAMADQYGVSVERRSRNIDSIVYRLSTDN